MAIIVPISKRKIDVDRAQRVAERLKATTYPADLDPNREALMASLSECRLPLAAILPGQSLPALYEQGGLNAARYGFSLFLRTREPRYWYEHVLPSLEKARQPLEALFPASGADGATMARMVDCALYYAHMKKAQEAETRHAMGDYLRHGVAAAAIETKYRFRRFQDICETFNRFAARYVSTHHFSGPFLPSSGGHGGSAFDRLLTPR